ncbi:MAG: prolipoprotein diacylglyceryl transferase family protein [Candidatus Korobacteraceae bacterium]|jgi:prolipoprotein diacylglyceryl transferase
MLNIISVAALALGLFALLAWGVRTLSSERWQMLAAIPVAKSADGSWRGLNLTFYGFFSAAGTTFGFSVMLLLLAALRIPAAIGIALALLIVLVSVPASRIVAALVERKRDTFTVAGAAFVTALIFPLVLVALRPLLATLLHRQIAVLPILAAGAIAYVLGESVGRLACLSFGCCYGMPLREARPAIARLFQTHHLVVQGATKKAAYASGLAGEPLVPVQAITSAIYAVSGVAGVALFLWQQWRLAALVPMVASWGWRACSESLRADHRGSSRISAYQVMAIFSVMYLSVFVALLPLPVALEADLSWAFAQVFSAPVILLLQIFWLALFLYYGRSRVTGSTLLFHVIPERV